MYIRYQLASLLENTRILLIVALLFAAVSLVQYVEVLPGNASFSLFYAGKAQVALVLPGNSSNSCSTEKSSDDWNSATSYGLNLTDFHGSNSNPEDESPFKNLVEVKNTSKVPEKGLEDSQNEPASDDNIDRESIPSASTASITKQSSDSLPPFRVSAGMGADSTAPIVSVDLKASSIHENASHTFWKTGSPVVSETDFAPSLNHSSTNSNHNVKKTSKRLRPKVSLKEINDMFISNLTSYHAKEPQWTSKSDQELLLVKSAIQSSSSITNDPSLHAPLFRNFSMFKRSYELMEQTLKVYIYEEGERPIFHKPELQGIYASEGWFMKQLKESKQYVTKIPTEAHLFYLPFSSMMLRIKLSVKTSLDHSKVDLCLINYISLIRSKYPFWNRTEGADHFLVACHDWGPVVTEQILSNCIRSLCNADMQEGFQFGKDVSLPETNVRSHEKPLSNLGGKPPSKRRILAFFAGRMHGYVRDILMKYWEDKDPDMKIFRKRPAGKGQMSYIEHMKSSKYCICAKGNDVNSPRVVEALFYECVPVIISDNFVPPFFETLNWESFAVFVREKEIQNLKNILLAIPNDRYLELQMKVKLVQQHFLWHSRPVKYDIFHMILHSIWYTRVFQLGSI